jgi:SAM-dependent methyltransferase
VTGERRTGRPTRSLDPAYFEALYGRDSDPWRFATSPYENAKYEATLAALPRNRYRRGLEVGCSIGVLTERLGRRCRELLAVDVAEAALAEARRRCAELPGVAFRRMRLPDEAPCGSFDLVVLSEVLYYWSAADVTRVAGVVRRALEPGGDAVLVHWVRDTDYPLSGDEAVEFFLGAFESAGVRLRSERTRYYRLDLVRRR